MFDVGVLGFAALKLAALEMAASEVDGLELAVGVLDFAATDLAVFEDLAALEFAGHAVPQMVVKLDTELAADY